jgi:divalent metal cation (Fe/Co/Zn/Cd) transporter
MYIERGSIVQEAAVSLLTTWKNFYDIIGSAAASLTGLMFVVITLIAGTRQRRSSGSAAAFGTPTVVHFGAALLVAAILSAPWQALWPAGLLLGLSGFGGVTYVVIVVRRARQQTDYQPVLEDWLWHTVFPLVSYTALVVAAIMLLGNPALALFVTGAVTVLLLFIGIHNAWDNVTYIAIELSRPENKSQD